jgi:hypothetical protein
VEDDGTNNLRSLLLVRTALGTVRDYGAATKQELRLPPLNPDTGFQFDSVRGGPHNPTGKGAGINDSRMSILYDLGQVYPEYIVTFSVK